MQNSIVNKYTGIFESTKAKVKAMQEELTYTVKTKEDDIKKHKDDMAKTILTTAESGRKNISEELHAVFSLKDNTVQSTKHLQTFNDLKDIGIMRVENEYQFKHNQQVKRHRAELSKIDSYFHTAMDAKQKEMKEFMKTMNDTLTKK